MAEVLPFERGRRGVRIRFTKEEIEATRHAPPAWTPLLELGPGGSLAGATSEEVQQRALEANPMRLLVTRACTWCEHEWTQPSRTGACPKCHASDAAVVNLGERPCMAQRLK
jgi:hypothetical protein